MAGNDEVVTQTRTAPPRRRFDGQGAVEAGGRTVEYDVHAGFVPLLEGEVERAEIFFTYYAARGPDAQRRPLTFVMNGGPGASSAYLHMGALGPRRIAMKDDGGLPPSPVRLVDNAESWLAFTDLCFIDPVGCGLSRLKKDGQAQGAPHAGGAPVAGSGSGSGSATKADDDAFYWGVDKDLSSLCAFVDSFLSREKRWSSPICLAGESYGGYRVARLVRMLQEKAGVGLSAAYLISPVIEWDTLFASRFVTQRFMAIFPSYVAAAVAHGRAPESSLREAEQFAVRDLVLALTPGAMSEKEREAIYSRIAAMTGLKEEVVRRWRGRIELDRFCRELLRDEGKTLGRYDAFVTTEDPFPDQDAMRAVDPTLGGVTRLFNVGVNAHLRETLSVDEPRRYELINFEANAKWAWGDPITQNPIPAGAAEDLLLGVGMNPDMRVVISHGHYDLITPYFDSNLLVARLSEESPLAKKLVLRHYPGGHMFYSRKDARCAFFEHVRADFAASSGGAG